MPGLLRRRPLAAVTGLLAVLLVVGIASLLLPGPGDKTAVAYFPRAVHVYAGSEVDVLGVRIGTVRSVTPDGDRVRVVLAYAADRKIPANASAVILEPTLVADRVVQLTPAYSGGPVLADRAEIPLARTAIPIELDEFNRNLTALTEALGPNGANRGGALSRLVEVGAANLDGQGAAANRTLDRVSKLMATLGQNRGALFGTVRNLQAFTTVLAQHDADTRAFTTDLADVSAQLDAERAAFSAALDNLGTGLAEVTKFVRTNRSSLSADVATLSRVTQILAKERTLLGRIADMGAVGISNYPHMYTPSARTYNSRFNNIYTENPALFMCQLYGSVGGSPQQCMQYLAPLKNVQIPPQQGAGR